MASINRTARARGLVALPVLLLACEPDAPTFPNRNVSQRSISASGMTPADSASYLLDSPENRTASTAAAVTSISLLAGDSLLISVVSTDCSGNPETVTVYGVISSIVASSSCATLPGTVVKVGPATTNGTVSFKATHQSYGEGPSGQVSGFFPDFTVGMNDGYGDTDYNDVVISVHVIFHCPPTSDPILNTDSVRLGLSDALIRSNPNAQPGSGLKREYGGIIWRAPDGHIYTQLVFDPNSTECTYDPQVLQQAAGSPPIDSSEALATFHTHPSGNFETTYGCPGFAQSPNDGKVPAKAFPDNPASGGGSVDGDWKSLSGYPMYVITKTNRIYRLDPQWASNPSQNPNKWNIGGLHGCPVLLP